MSLKQRLSTHVRSEFGARYLIENGLVKLNGRVIKDYTIQADERDIIELGDADPKLRLDAPDSYWRARIIQEQVGFVGLGDSVLHVETRDGGFPLVARDYSGDPFVITAKESLPIGKIIGKNPFTIKLGEIQTAMRARSDVMVQELELDVIKCFQILERLLPTLKSRGKLILFLSTHDRDAENLKEMAQRFLPDMSVDVHEVFEFKEGVYVYGKRKS